MRHILLAPGSFKGTLSSQEICLLMEAAILDHMDASIISLPLSDTAECPHLLPKSLNQSHWVLTFAQHLGGSHLHQIPAIAMAQQAKIAGVPVIALVDSVGINAQEAYALGINAIFSIRRSHAATTPFHIKEDLLHTTEDIARFLQTMHPLTQ